MIFLVLLYRAWKAEGGDSNYVPPSLDDRIIGEEENIKTDTIKTIP
jgi:hypothetical protein